MQRDWVRDGRIWFVLAIVSMAATVLAALESQPSNIAIQAGWAIIFVGMGLWARMRFRDKRTASTTALAAAVALIGLVLLSVGLSL